MKYQLTNNRLSTSIAEIMAAVKWILVYSDMVSARLMLTLGALGWGGMLLFPIVFDWHVFLFPETIDAHKLNAPHNPYFVMATMMPQIVWGLAFLFHGIFMLVSLSRKIDRAVHAIDAFCGALLWTTMTWTMAMSHYIEGHPLVEPIPLVMEFVASFVSIWWLTRIIIDKDVSDGQR